MMQRWRFHRGHLIAAVLAGLFIVLISKSFTPTRKERFITSDIGLALNEEPPVPLHSSFQRYHGPDSAHPPLLPTWIITPGSVSSLHRFFDTSPISPSGTYLAIVRIHVHENRLYKKGDTAEVIVVNLFTGNTTIVATTTGWDYQVGAHVQWGSSDRELYFNDIDTATSTAISYCVDVTSGSKRRLPHPIYHVSSDGRFSAAPDISKIRFTQLGYGVYLPHATPQRNASAYDGLYIMDLHHGKQHRVVTFRELALHAGVPPSTPMYGFHTKWSSDNSLVMFVVRTLSDSADGSEKRVRSNHLFVVTKHGEILCRVVSWSSYPSTKDSLGKLAKDLRDGNHPNWITGTHNISVNYAGRDGIWRVAIFDVDAIVHRRRQGDLSDPKPIWGYPYGSGHPNFFPDTRYALIDAYLKEQWFFADMPLDKAGGTGVVPLRLVDTHTLREVHLLDVSATP